MLRGVRRFGACRWTVIANQRFPLDVGLRSGRIVLGAWGSAFGAAVWGGAEVVAAGGAEAGGGAAVGAVLADKPQHWRDRENREEIN